MVGWAAVSGCQPSASGIGTGLFADASCTIADIEPRDGNLRVENVVQLGGEGSGPGLLDEVTGMTNLVRDRLGRYWMGQGGAVKLFGPDGEYLSEVGREGQGPLEFSRSKVVHADSMGRVHVLDIGNKRVSVVDEDLSLVAAVNLPTFASQMSILDGNYVLAGWIPSGDHAGHPAHVVKDGQVVASFGTLPADLAASPLEQTEAMRKILATGDDGTVFVASDREYVIEAWKEDGQRVGRIKGPAMDNGPRQGGWTDDNPPDHRLRDIRLGRDGLLWAILEYRRPDWRDGVVERIGPNGNVLLTASGYDDQKIFRYRIDVVDLDACTAVASQWIDDANILGAFVVGLGGRIEVTDLAYGNLGDPLVRVLSVALAR